MDFSVRICGEAGQGLQSAGKLLLSALAKAGYEVFAYQDYESRVRGGSNFFQIRIADIPLTAYSEEVDVLIAMTPQAYQVFSGNMAENGLAVHPGPQDDSGYKQEVVHFDDIALDQGGSKKMASAVVAGLIWACAAEDTEILEAELAIFFADLKEELIQGNVKAARAGFTLAREMGISPRKGKGRAGSRLLMRGNDAIALGAIAAGLKYVSAYPMTPSTSIVEYIASAAQEVGIRVEQAEDEIAAINMAIGASYAGVRAMTATSGGGFCLMTEAVGLAGSAEIPVVIINGQRPGPSTGLPTRTEQGDLLFAIHAGHGDFPLAVLAPGSVEEGFFIMAKAFNIAEEYQVPVVVLTDQYMADSFQTIQPPELSQIEINRGAIVTEPDEDYQRYALTESGISPRVYPGSKPAVVVCAGDEHDQDGHLIEEARMRTAMMDKRMRKVELIRENALSPVCVGSENPDLILMTWGSTWGIAHQAMQDLPQGVRLIHLPQLWPLPVEDILELLGDCPVYTVEGNYSGQLAALLAMHAIDVKGSLTRYDGRPITPSSIVNFVREVM